MTQNDAYKKAGVDIDAADRLIDRIKPLAKATARAGADAALGGFGGAFDLKATGYKDPILVSGTDGVGTKLKIAIATGHHDTIGIDLVAMCVNDVLAQGAEPLFFLDYFATGKLNETTAQSVIAGIAQGCQQAGCALIGGETAEMPSMYKDGDYDLAGFCVGAVERDQMLPRPPKGSAYNGVQNGDIMIGIASSGPHANGYSLIRQIVSDSKVEFEDPAPFDTSQTLLPTLPATLPPTLSATLGQALLTPTRIYIKSVLPCLKAPTTKAFAHITGGGLTDNVPRVLPEGLIPHFDDSALSLPPIFQWLKSVGNLSNDEMMRTFNCGIGGVLIVSPDTTDEILTMLRAKDEDARIIGHIKKA